MGSRSKADDFFREYWADALAIGDPSQKLYRAFGIRLGDVRQFFKPGVWKAYWQNRDFGIGVPHGNTMRNPGAVLVRENQVVFEQRFAHFGEQVDVAAVKAASMGDA